MATLGSNTATSRVGGTWSRVQPPGPLCAVAGQAAGPHTDPLLALPLVCGNPRVGAVEKLAKVPGTQEEDRLLSSGLHSLPMSTPGCPCSAHCGPRHVGGGSHLSLHTQCGSLS